MIKQGDRAQTNYRRSETLPYKTAQKPDRFVPVGGKYLRE